MAALGTPYVTPSMLENAPIGVSWSIIPAPGATTAAQAAAITDICWKATSRVDTYCGQPLRSTADTEYLNGPGLSRCTVDRNTGNGVLIMRRWPVTEVLAIQTSPARSFPRVWTPVPAGNWDIRHPLTWCGDTAAPTMPDGGWTVDVAPGWITWRQGGRGGLRVQVCHLNGWPHTSLTTVAAAGETVLQVDDVTGWGGAAGWAYDGSATEQLSAVSGVATTPLVLPNGAGLAQAGPGTITLTAGLASAHPAGTVISALPATVIEATVYAAAAQALMGGIDAVSIQEMPGGKLSSGSPIADIATELELLLDPFRRIA